MQKKDNQPTLVVEYTDPHEGFKGWLAIDRQVHSLCAGGMRVQPGLTREHLIAMAGNMTCKMRMAGLRVDGAKCGIDYDPGSSGKADAVARFLKAIAPFIRETYSMGPDLNIDMAELEEAAVKIGIPSVKMAIARAQGWDLDYFLERSKVLSEQMDDFTLGRLRAGYGVSAAVLGTLSYLGIAPENARIVVQGFGNLAKAALYGLSEAGCRIVAISDENKSIISVSETGLDIRSIISSPSSLLPEITGSEVKIGHRETIFDCDGDILVPAAKENTVPPELAETIRFKAVVPGANLAVPVESDMILAKRCIPVLPDFLAGCGGSLSMEGLYGPEEHPSAQKVLAHVKSRMLELVEQVLAKSRLDNTRPTTAALTICAEREDRPGSRPYGRP